MHLVTMLSSSTMPILRNVYLIVMGSSASRTTYRANDLHTERRMNLSTQLK